MTNSTLLDLDDFLIAGQGEAFKFHVYCPVSYYEDFLIRKTYHILETTLENLMTEGRGEFRRLL